MDFEKCEGCWIKNKDECLKLFGSKVCARILIENGELKKDLIEASIKIVFNPNDSQQVELMEAIQKIFNKCEGVGGFCSGCRNFDCDKLGKGKGYCSKYEMPIEVAKGVCKGVVE